MSHLQGKLWRVLILGKVIGRETVPEPVIGPLSKLRGRPELVDVEVIPPMAVGVDSSLSMSVRAQPGSEIGRNRYQPTLSSFRFARSNVNEVPLQSRYPATQA